MAADSLKVTLPAWSLKHEGAMRAHSDNSKMKAKKFFHALHEIIGTTRLYAAAFSSITPGPCHFKSHGYGQTTLYNNHMT